jgi:hypothetical protein
VRGSSVAWPPEGAGGRSPACSRGGRG